MTQGSFLARIRAALAGIGRREAQPAPLSAEADWMERASEVRAEAVRRWDELLPRFGVEVEAIGGVLHRASGSELPSVIGRIARERGLSHVVAWSEQALGVAGLLARLEAERLTLEDASDLSESASAASQIYASTGWAEIGLTGSEYAIADSGTLVLQSGVGKNRLVSCLPAIHIAILRRGYLLGSLEDVGVLLECENRQLLPGEFPRVIDFVTGPSRTADIEMSLTRGIHGPKEVHVIAVS